MKQQATWPPATATPRSRPPAGSRTKPRPTTSRLSWSKAGAAAELLCALRYASAEHWVDFFCTYYGPMHRAFASEWSRSERGTLVVPGEYLEVVITRA